MRPTWSSRGHCWVALTKNVCTPSPVKSISGPWKMLIYPSPHILCLSTYLTAATLSELRHQSTSRCISVLPKQFITNYLEVRCPKSVSWAKIKVLVGLCYLWGLWRNRENHFLPFPGPRGDLHSLAYVTLLWPLLLSSQLWLWLSCLFQKDPCDSIGPARLSRLNSSAQDPYICKVLFAM